MRVIVRTETPPPQACLWMGLLSAGAGLFIVLLSLGVVPADDSQFRAQRWIAGLAGLAFLLAGGTLLSQALVGKLGGSSGLLQTVQGLFGLAILVAFAAIANWIAFGPGERNFQGSLTLPFLGFLFRSPDSFGRALFGIVAVLLDLLLLVLVVRGLRALWGYRGGTASPGS